ncbi:hypothetical protein [Roseicyclus persicicus]|uniref:Uncharacterized protein n=1 Tax=Roseicyclus persicicus TaxID=2650661 RepID=A0A7X6GZP8_9RHOB|nr:hypothetical protein [Roseibacterium persicicum]NKX45347.1 hypothetical protein [Roseibacterium persicicum]
MQAGPSLSVPTRSVSWRRSLGIVALFALAGPLLGGLGVNLLLTAVSVAQGLGDGAAGDLARRLVGGIIGGSIFAVLLAYAIGTAPALVVGAVMAACDRRGRGLTYGDAAAAALACALVAAAGVVLLVEPGARAAWIAALVTAHLLGALGCTWAARRWPGPA